LTLEELYTAAVQDANRGQYAEAIRKLELILTHEIGADDKANLSALLGSVYLMVGNNEQGVRRLKEALSVVPNNSESWTNLSEGLRRLGRLDEAVEAARQALTLKPDHADAYYNMGVALKDQGKLNDAIASYRKALTLKPDYAEAHYNMGVALKDQGKLDDSIASYRQALTLKPDYAEAYYNMGGALHGQGKLDDSIASYRQALTLKPDYAEAHDNMGVTFTKLDRLEEAEASLRQAIALKPDFAEAHSNLGVALQKLDRLDEAEASYAQAIALKPDYANAHCNLGVTLKELGRIDEAEASYTQAIELKPDFALAHYGLSKVLYSMTYKDAALESIKRANVIDPKSKDISLLLSVLQARKSRENTEIGTKDIITSNCLVIPPSIILELNKSVEPELTAYLYSRKLLDLNKETDPSFGDTRGSKYNLFEDNHPTIQKLALDLNSILMKTFNSDVFIKDSFFSIFGAGGGTARHAHVDKDDKDLTFSLAKQKYALVYYLSVGDQDCTEPGILNFYEPSQEILPSKGLITIFPAGRYHSSLYGGNKDRVIVGINFYTL
jgi:tetratricopeptide (TPR) repeat protein